MAVKQVCVRPVRKSRRQVFSWRGSCDSAVFTLNNVIIYEPRCEKTGLGVSDQVRHKPGCTATEYGERLEILDLESRGIALSMLRKQRRWSALRLPRSWSASLFSHMQKAGFLTMRLIYVLYIKGDEVKSKLISTDNTWAFGWKKAMFGRKSWGFFPTEVVKRVDEGSLKRPLVDWRNH